jgi:hypothetical protein
MSKRKPYRPRPVSAIGGLFAIDKRNRLDSLKQTLDDEQLADLGLAYRLAYQSMVDGNASEMAWSTVVGSLNIGLILAERGFGSEYTKSFVAALDACWRAKRRADDVGAWGFDGAGQQAIKFALGVHDAQVEEAPKYALTEAIAEVHRRYENGSNYQTREAA